MAEAPHPFAPRRLTHDQARAEQRLYWATRTPEERLAAMHALNQRMRQMRGIETHGTLADFPPRRVTRRPR